MKKVFTLLETFLALDNTSPHPSPNLGEGAIVRALRATSAGEVKKSAFTLAEVLITLAIIGVVAAMTMPTLIANYQKQVWVNQLKKHVSTMQQGFQKILADDGVDKLSNTKLASAHVYNIDNNVSTMCIGADFKDVDCKNETDILKQIFHITAADIKTNVKNSQNNEVEMEWHWAFPDGTLVFIEEYDMNEVEYEFWYYVDVNGAKGPNKLGRDVFYLAIYDNGHIGYFKDCQDEENEDCAADRIIKNGWKMDY